MMDSTHETSTSVFRNSPLAIALLLLALWAQLFWALHPTWIHGQYYDYGWIVGPISIWFFYRRWTSLNRKQTDALVERSGFARIYPWILLGLLLPALTFFKVLENFDPIWRVPLILHGGFVLVFTHLLIADAYGKKASLSFLPVTLFAMTAVPWPAQAENFLVGEMTETLLAISAPISRMVGIPVELSGSALIANGVVIQIDEGCSGIRSFQSLLMAGFFVGEFMMLSVRARVLIVLLGIVYGFVTNTFRATLLTWIFYHKGQIAFDQFHDPVGLFSFAIAAGLLLVTGHLIDSYTKQTNDPAE